MTTARDKLQSCYQKPPIQHEVGSSPEAFIRELGDAYVSSLALLPGKGTRRLDREKVRQICQNQEVDVLVAYCVVMRWGGRNPHNFRLSIADSCRPKLGEMLQRLRGSTRNRKDDFREVQQQSLAIKGLGISFYTKLLFFFRAKNDSYILDQWTAKSAKLLFNPSPVRLSTTHFPSPETTPEEYEDFCKSVEGLRYSFTPPWQTGEEVECALFSAPGKTWRKEVDSHFSTNPKQKGTKASAEVLGSSSPPSAKEQLARRIGARHKEMAKAGISLPSHATSVVNLASDQPRVDCGRYPDMNWQYNVNKGSVNVQLNFHGHVETSYKRLRIALGASAGSDDFGDGIHGNGSSVVCIRVPQGASADPDEWPKIAREAVYAMNRLHERITAALT